jgi:hypothetical protein
LNVFDIKFNGIEKTMSNLIDKDIVTWD